MNKHVHQGPRSTVCTKGTPPIAAETFKDAALDTLDFRYPKRSLEGEKIHVTLWREHSIYFHWSKTIKKSLEIVF